MISSVESTNDKIKTYLANGSEVAKNDQKTFFKFFIGVLLLNLVIVSSKAPIDCLISFNAQSLS